MWQKLLTILILTVALIILGVTLFNAYKHRPVKENEPSSEVEVGVSPELYVEANHKQNNGGAFQHEETEITAYIKEVFGVDSDFGLSTAFCESSLRVDAVSPSGKYIGLYQFDNNTFYSNCDGDIGNWKDQVVCAKELYEKGEATKKQHWPNCP